MTWITLLESWNGGNLLKHHQCAGSTLDDATAAILCQNAHHTHQLIGEEETVMKPISIYGDV